MNIERMRVILAEELETAGEPGIARAVRAGWDSSSIGLAATRAMTRVMDETAAEVITGKWDSHPVEGDKT